MTVGAPGLVLRQEREGGLGSEEVDFRRAAGGPPRALQVGRSEFQALQPLAPRVLTSGGTVQEARHLASTQGPCLGQAP